jgi:hypothetical protein
MLLHPGAVSRSLQVPLSPTDLAREQLVVSFSLQGNGPSAQCQTDTGYAAIAEIETTSAVHLTLDRPLNSVSDRVNAWGGVVRVGWPQWLDPKEQARRLVLATQFKQHNVPTAFLDDHTADALSTVELREAFPILAVSHRTPDATVWPKQVAVKGANAGLRRFQDATRWRIHVDLRDDHEMRIPTELDLRLTLGRQALADQWSVTVTLNERLVHEDLLDRTATGLEKRITLPAEIITATNVIEVTATSTRTNEGSCNRPIALIAEMLPETALTAGEATFSDDLSLLQSHLSNMAVLNIGTISGLSAAEADVATDLLAQVVPIDVVLKPETQMADIVVVTPNDAGIALPDAAPIWLVARDAMTGALIVTHLAPNSPLPRNAFGLLIIPGGINLAEVSL